MTTDEPGTTGPTGESGPASAGDGSGSGPGADGGDRWERRHRDRWQRQGGRQHRHGPPWAQGDWDGRRRGPWPAFGCLFALLFLVVAATLITVAGAVVSALGPVAGVITVLVVVAVLFGIGRTFRRTARSLDELVDATRRVEGGDYTVRVGTPRRGMRPVRDLARGFDTMVERLAADETQRRTWLADVSHELRTPLTVIAGDVEAMIDGVHPTDPAHLEAVLEETRIMRRLVEDLRTMTLSEAGTLGLHPEPTDPDVLIEEVVRSFEGSAAAVGLTVRADVPVDLPILDVDPVRIREVLANLVANAIRHTPAGGSVTVRGVVAGEWLELRVIDTGPGIDPDVLPQVFERFVAGPGSGGSGLGLAIARSLVDAHGGSLEVEATGRTGTTFRIRLPIS